jgi:hypothetical protein
MTMTHFEQNIFDDKPRNVKKIMLSDLFFLKE